MLQICKKLSNHDDCKIKVRTLKEKLCGNKKKTLKIITFILQL